MDAANEPYSITFIDRMIGARLPALVLIACAALTLGSVGAWAQDWPNRPVKVIVPYGPGGITDVIARLFGDRLTKAYGQPFVIENRGGAGGAIGTEYAVRSPNDGYTIYFAGGAPITILPQMQKLSFDPTKDLTPVGMVTVNGMAFTVHPDLPVRSLQDLIALAKKKPGSLNYTSSGNGSAPHLGAAHFSAVTGVEMVHIPYKGGAPAIAAVVAGDAQLTFGTPPSVLPMVQAGRLRAIAVTSPNRTPLVPNVPGTAESGLPSYGLSFWYGLFVPVGTPPEIVRRLFDAAQDALQRTDVKAVLAREGAEIAPSRSPDEFAAFLEGDNRFWAKLVKDAGVKPE